ncbi:MAG: ATP-binding protein [Deltaproteobacteria bacterium]|nr:ATP-binding protein [Deltaproteobacteria bacterium]
MRRKSLLRLEVWGKAPNRTPLLIRGARQVGKTWLVREYAKSFSSFVEINFESHPEFRQPFQELFGKPQELLSAIALVSGKKIVVGETLLFLDEIQYSKEALLALRYFKEELPQLHVIGCGSLLEFTIRELSFPVGRIEFLYLFPLNFEEYLLALKREDLVEAIRRADTERPLPQAVHELLLKEIGMYCLVGGMPEVVHAYLQMRDLAESERIQSRLIGTFREDFYKYASRAKTEHLRRVFEGIPRLFGQKFKYAHIDAESHGRDLKTALELLEGAGLVYRTFHTSAHGIPLGSQVKENRFKVFLVDIGLSLRMLGLNLSQLFLEQKVLLANRGPLAEQFVAQEIVSYTKVNDHPKLFYWHREAKSSMAEVDFVIEKENAIWPIEVKSARGTKIKSLYLFMREREAVVPGALKISAEPFSQREKVTTIPLYAVGNLF